MIKFVNTFQVIPSIPARLEKLRELAYNLHWSWHHEAIDLFRRLDSDLWESSGHNPVLMLGRIGQNRLEAVAEDPGFLAHLERVYQELQSYLTDRSTWFCRTYRQWDSPLVAYFSAEFGVTECMSIFAGGLGVLAGDHLKSASDLGIPLVGVGLLYQQGYFRQYLNESGWQQEAYEDNDFHNLPLVLQEQPGGEPLLVRVPHPGRQVTAQVWRAQVGRVPLYLLDTNLAQNRPEDRDITDQLYGGDLETRMRQEMVLGIGGFRALQALGQQPLVYHANEGHSAFLALERIRFLMESQGLTFNQAREVVSSALIFTTHTPVAAGQDYFPPALVERYFSEYAREMGLGMQEFTGLGRINPMDEQEQFCMTTLALRTAAYSNGVSRLHGQVSRRMWQVLWPRVPEDEIPIEHVTNGVHLQSWISREMKELYDRYLGLRWREEPAEMVVWEGVKHIAAEELWRTHERRRERLVAYCRGRLRQQLVNRGASQAEIEAADEVLDPQVLTVGFARRFATYKRAALLLHDLPRLEKIINHPNRPVQFIFAGKAHPKDEPGKQLIQRIITLARQDPYRRRIVFLEDYDMAVSRYLVQGSDVWLNTPLRFLEASGTSGMKAVANGVLNLSILDGWWDEAYQPEVGWSIGRRETYDNRDYQDQVEAAAMYDLLEREVVPLFYGCGPDGLPRRWIDKMKASIKTLCSFFNTHRMVGDYTRNFYLPAAKLYGEMVSGDFALARAQADWKACVRQKWPQVRIDKVIPVSDDTIKVGDEVQVQAQVNLGELKPEDVVVELYLGRVSSREELTGAQVFPMQVTRFAGAGNYLYQAAGVTCHHSGLHGYTVRVLPYHPNMTSEFWPGYILWA